MSKTNSTGIHFECDVCKKPFEASYTQAKRGNGVCSKSCAGKCQHRKPLEERFWAKVSNRGGNGCWEWTGSISHLGYGVIYNGKYSSNLIASRVSWQINFGDPGELCVCHKCDNRKCVRPDHLFLGTISDNNKDRSAKGRNPNQNGSRNAMAILTETDVLAIRQRHATCKVTHKVLAAEFEVSPKTVGQIIRRERWKHI